MGITRWRGTLAVHEEYVPDLRRHAMVAKLLDDKGLMIEGLSPLYDARLLSAKLGNWVLTGMERVRVAPDRVADMAQTWLLVPVDELRYA